MTDILTSYNVIIEVSVIVILSFLFSEISRKTNIPAVIMLIALGIALQIGLQAAGLQDLDFLPLLEVLGIIGLIMIVLEAALELELKREKYVPIAKAFVIALIGLLGSMWPAALILHYSIEGMTMSAAWLYATPLSILSSAIIIPSVSGLKTDKKEFHIYESTFSDILGIMVFYFLSGQMDASEGSHGVAGFAGNVLLTIVVSLVASYIILVIFQSIRSNTKFFLLISVLLLLYSVGKIYHLSSLIIILVFGLLIANMELFFRGRLSKLLKLEYAKQIYEGLHVVTMETAFIVRTFFFVIFGLTISLATLVRVDVAVISLLIILSIYLVRFLILRVFIGRDILPQVFVAPRGLITILLFTNIPEEAQIAGFQPGILLFIIIGTSLIMTFAMVSDKRRTSAAVRKAQSKPVGFERWKAPAVTEVREE
ncbi:MAG TPA: cation:proton antiporter [Flavilitoribacter sp.]|nr:cation:proton antiporter [Lewinella sp.]MCB9280838.1 cation:proton antiporter [Lewinellaceae bacterium]HMQ64429.1 cation:proton antiporter [Flavilitoribacter sp.]HMQ87438.1 cation:proton antiporter [Flavilitoribacter sp.]